MQEFAERMVRAVRNQTVGDTDLIISWIVHAAQPVALVRRALPRALLGETYTVIDSFYGAILMIPAFDGFNLHAAVSDLREAKCPLLRKN